MTTAATQPALLARLDAPRVKLIADALAANPKASSLTKDMLEKQRKKGSTLTGSDVADLNKLIGAPARAVAEVIIFAATAGGVVAEPATPSDPAPPVVVKPAEPVPAPTHPIDVKWSAVADMTSVVWQGVKLGAQSAGKPYSLQLSNDGVERYEIRDGDHSSNDGKTTDKERSELSGLTTRDQGLITFEQEIFLEDATFAEDAEVVIGQLHKGKAKNGITGDHPPAAFRILPGGFPALTVCGSNAYPLTKADIDAAKSVKAWVGKDRFPTDRWVKIKIVLNQGGDDQYAELWIDDQRMVHYVPKPGQAIGYKNPEAPPYWKRGLYRAKKASEPLVVFIRDVRAY